MEFTEKIGSLYLTNEQANGTIFKLTFDNLPENYKVPLKLGLFGLKKNAIYYVRLEIFNEDNQAQINDSSIKINTNDIEVSDSNSFNSETFSSLFGISSAALNVNKGSYKVKITLLSNDSTTLDCAYTYFYATA